MPRPFSQARKVIQNCETDLNDEIQIAYDERNPFVICNKSFGPIYRGSELTHCSYCKAAYLPQFKGIVCEGCTMGLVGGEGTGPCETDADGKFLS
mmetsp:Transcript_28239/g.86286  ORF Transcript_28239/g.86286 Transcript_28239/m.86286 type:complete len:95 (+) Transcript_28239:3631-3915(+)